MASLAARSAPAKVVSPHDEVVLTPHLHRTAFCTRDGEATKRAHCPIAAHPILWSKLVTATIALPAKQTHRVTRKR